MFLVEGAAESGILSGITADTFQPLVNQIVGLAPILIPVMIAVMGVTIGLNWFKKLTKKATN